MCSIKILIIIKNYKKNIVDNFYLIIKNKNKILNNKLID
jgi:hypothetical protein